jgi:hypothetical protein
MYSLHVDWNNHIVVINVPSFRYANHFLARQDLKYINRAWFYKDYQLKATYKILPDGFEVI